NASAEEVLRKKEPVYKDLGLDQREVSDDELIALMAEHPQLLQRPIVERGDRAVLARPPERVLELLD
ncbi:MAG TPA: ArsC/Spx/MgsR family protein, partial [Thermoleophilaceae bacterium]|nr:ArsC/Spx/MgsR family protein [Thermoleophilaceae bacterium]